MTSIRRNLMAQLLLGVWVLVLLGGLGLHLSVRALLTRQFDQTLEARATGLAASIHWDGTQIDFESPPESMPWFAANGPEYFELRDAGRAPTDPGQPLARSLSLAGAAWPASVPDNGSPRDVRLPGGTAGRAASLTFTPQPDEEPGEKLRADVRETLRSSAPRLTLLVAKGREDLNRAISAVAGALAGAGVVLSAGVYLAVSAALSRGLRPIQRLSSQVQGIGADSLSTRVDIDGVPEELLPVYSRLNDLLGRLEHAFARERRFTQAAAHELRTPLAELRSLLEVSLSRPRREDESTETIAESLGIAEQMSALVDGLFWLVRPGREAGELRRIDVVPLVRAIASKHMPRAAARDGSISVEGPAQVYVLANAALLMTVLENVISNAVDHACPAPVVRCEISAHEATITVKVTNPAGDLSPSDVERFFEPFWRRSESRTERHHLGLGLSIARAAAEAMGGSLTAASARSPEPTVTLRLELTRSEPRPG